MPLEFRPSRHRPDEAPLEEQVRQVFGQICATCHGREGGGTRIAPSLQAFKGTDEQFIGTVLEGALPERLLAGGRAEDP